MSTKHLTWLRRFTLACGVGTFVFVFSRSGFELPAQIGLRFAGASILSLVGLGLAACGWSELVGVPFRLGFRSFATTLPLRHLPLGGFGQIASLAGLSVAEGTDKKRASQAGTAFLGTTAAGASLVAAPLALDGGVAAPIRLAVAMACLASITMLWVGPRILDAIGSKWKAVAGMSDLPLIRSTMWAVGAAACAGSGFALVFDGFGSFLQTVSGFSAAWLGGFLFVIAPAGLGAREALLVVIWPSVDAASVFSASLVHRVSMLVAEVILLIAALFVSRSHKTQTLERM